MTVDQMLSELAQRLEDVNANEFSSQMKLDALNNGQDRLVTMVDNQYLTELETLDQYTNQGKGNDNPKLSNGIFNLSNLTQPILNGSIGVMAVKIHGGKYMNRINLSGVKEFDSTMVEADISDPYYIVFSDRIEVIPTTTVVTIPIDVYYQKKPTALSSGGNCDLNAGLHHLLIGLAESYCWSNSEEQARSLSAEKVVFDQIAIINSKD